MKVLNALNVPMMKEYIDKENINLDDKCDCVQREDNEKPKDSSVCDQTKCSLSTK